MINSMQMALIKKDIKSITANKRMFSVILIVPLVLTVFMPSIFILSAYFVPEETSDFQQLLELLPSSQQTGDLTRMIMALTINNIMPMFFAIIPIMAASVMAASSFVGEKEKRTLETLLYCPLTLKQIFYSKILASFAMSMAVSLISFLGMTVVTQVEILLLTGSMLLPDINWVVILLLVAPAVSLIAITMIVRGSAKAQTVEEAQQRAAFLILPIVLLMVGQFTGFILISVWILLGFGAILAVIAWIYMQSAMRKVTYEMVLN